MIFPKPHTNSLEAGKFKFPTTLTVSCDNKEFLPAIDYLKLSLDTVYGIKCQLADTVADIEFTSTDVSAEEYTLNIANNGVLIGATDLRGAIYASSSLVQLIERDNGFYIPCQTILDSPYTEIRGIHFYMPARDEIEDFKRLIDFMALIKMNTVILEVGGGMEYERHPEINEAWVKFCKTINDFPGLNGYKSFQGSDFYWKDSLHTELCNGSFLTKREVKDLVDYCKARGMDVIPEVQGLSHCYYLTIPHPEIAELSDDPFPDTYCPNNEKSYELYFDVAEEVIEVFDPTTVSIGHDEIRVLGWCDKCKDKTGAELVGGDILKHHEFYSKRGIRIAMWAESAQSFDNYLGARVGEKDVERTDKFGRYYKLPATYECIDKIPSDILMLDWYHSMGHHSEDCFDKRGFDVIYGNFHGTLFGEWDERSAKECIKGAEVSSWCPATAEIFARDGITFDALFSAYILWNDEYTNNDFDMVCNELRAVMPIVKAICEGKPADSFKNTKIEPIFKAESKNAPISINLSKACLPDNTMKNALSVFGDTLYGTPIHTGNLVIRKEFYAQSLLFLHNCTEEMPFYPSHYFCDENMWGIGSYVVCYEDGTVECANVYYGRQIGVSNFAYTRYRDEGTKLGVEIDNELEVGQNKAIPCYYSLTNTWLESLTYNTTPLVGEDASVFVFEWKNPHPDKKIIKIKPYSVATNFNDKNSKQEINLFAVGAV